MDREPMGLLTFRVPLAVQDQTLRKPGTRRMDPSVGAERPYREEEGGYRQPDGDDAGPDPLVPQLAPSKAVEAIERIELGGVGDLRGRHGPAVPLSGSAS